MKRVLLIAGVATVAALASYELTRPKWPADPVLVINVDQRKWSAMTSTEKDSLMKERGQVLYLCPGNPQNVTPVYVDCVRRNLHRGLYHVSVASAATLKKDN